jgi:hypothetical protein
VPSSLTSWQVMLNHCVKFQKPVCGGIGPIETSSSGCSNLLVPMGSQDTVVRTPAAGVGQPCTFTAATQPHLCTRLRNRVSPGVQRKSEASAAAVFACSTVSCPGRHARCDTSRPTSVTISSMFGHMTTIACRWQDTKAKKVVCWYDVSVVDSSSVRRQRVGRHIALMVPVPRRIPRRSVCTEQLLRNRHGLHS